MTKIYVDADGCPVKQEIYRVAQRYGLQVILVANSGMHIPPAAWLKLVLVDDGLDAADDWIAEHIGANDITVTADIPLASRCLKRGARVLGPKGRVFTEEGIGDALASREIASQLREHGIMTGGPAPFGKEDRSRFLQNLDAMIHACRE